MGRHDEWQDKSWYDLAEELQAAQEELEKETGRFRWSMFISGGIWALFLAFCLHLCGWWLEAYVERKVAEGQQPSSPTLYYYIPPAAGTSPNPEAKPNSDSFCHGNGCL